MANYPFRSTPPPFQPQQAAARPPVYPLDPYRDSPPPTTGPVPLSVYPGPPVACQDPGRRDAWQRLWARIPGSYADRSAAIYQLTRVGADIDPDMVIIRSVIVSQAFTGAAAAGTGATVLAFTFPTRTIINGVRALVGAGGASAFDFSLVINAGTDGGYAIGTDNNPISLTAIDVGAGQTPPIPLPPMVGYRDNTWQGVLTGAAGIAPTEVAISLYGLGMYTPNSQIA